MQLRTVLVVLLLAACGSKSPAASTPTAPETPAPPQRTARHQQPITQSTTPVTTGEKEQFWTTLVPKSGCTKTTWNGGEDAIECASEPGAPIFFFNADGGVTCDIAPDQAEQCEPLWRKANGE